MVYSAHAGCIIVHSTMKINVSSISKCQKLGLLSPYKDVLAMSSKENKSKMLCKGEGEGVTK